MTLLRALPIAVLALATGAAAAPVIQPVHVFTDQPDGSSPNASLITWRGKLWGTTLYGGTAGNGSVFSVDPATGREHVVYSFTGGSDGGLPFGSLVAFHGELYGTTYLGGANNWGTVFKVTLAGIESVLHSFANAPDGSLPQAGLTVLRNTLYGVTSGGGDSSCNGGTGCGIVFSVSQAGAYAQIAGFSNNSGWSPTGNLVAYDGALYGTTESGGTYGGGSAFRVTVKGKLKSIYQFGNGNDASFPSAALLPVNGLFYGTSVFGGASGSGTVFSVTTDGKEAVLYNFTGNADGAQPSGSLIAVGKLLYGTAGSGGAVGAGTVFAIDQAGKLKAATSLDGIPQGASSAAGLIEVGNLLYGTAYSGGSSNCNGYGCGTVFSVTP